jgi:hypothetical protein
MLMAQRIGLPVDVAVTEANDLSEGKASLTMLDRLLRRTRRTVAANDGGKRGSSLDRRTTCQAA